jgi:hypothetical protein
MMAIELHAFVKALPREKLLQIGGQTGAIFMGSRRHALRAQGRARISHWILVPFCDRCGSDAGSSRRRLSRCDRHDGPRCRRRTTTVEVPAGIDLLAVRVYFLTLR